jgi:hypothetical protein
MGQAEEAGQQPSRPPAARPGEPCAVPAGHASPEAGAAGPCAEAGACEIGDEDLAVPGDPRERARVENAGRRLAGRALADELAAAGYAGPVLEVTVNELAAYGIAALMAWTRTGEIARKCRARGRPLAGADRVTAAWSRGDRLELAVEAAARALRYFVDEVLRPGRWDYRRGATLRAYFVGACLLQFPNVYEAWVSEQKRWGAAGLAGPGAGEAAAPGRGDPARAGPVAGDVIRRLQVRGILAGIPGARAREAAQMVVPGYEQAEAGAELGLAAAAVGARLYRLRGRPG